MPLQLGPQRLCDKDDDDCDDSKCTDFSVLASASISVGGHFRFKSDKSPSIDILKRETSGDLLRLNLDVLDRSLRCLKFYRWCELDEEFVGDELRGFFDRKAEEAETVYEMVKKASKKVGCGSFCGFGLDGEFCLVLR